MNLKSLIIFIKLNPNQRTCGLGRLGQDQLKLFVTKNQGRLESKLERPILGSQALSHVDVLIEHFE